MTEIAGKQIVIDSCVASSSSSNQMYTIPNSNSGRFSRECLIAVSDSNHIIVFNKVLSEEWSKHASRFARHWRADMEAKGRLLHGIEGAEFQPLFDRACASFSTEASAFARDFHLIRAALATGQLIVSIEVRFPHIVAVACRQVPEFLSLYYANPAVEGEICTSWITAGAEKQPQRRIDVWAASH